MSHNDVEVAAHRVALLAAAAVVQLGRAGTHGRERIVLPLRKVPRDREGPRKDRPGWVVGRRCGNGEAEQHHHRVW